MTHATIPPDESSGRYRPGGEDEPGPKESLKMPERTLSVPEGWSIEYNADRYRSLAVGLSLTPI